MKQTMDSKSSEGLQTQNILQAIGILKSFAMPGRKLSILKGIDMNVEQGEMLSIVGPSGAGKSTLLHILGGLDTPDSGSVCLQEHDLYTLSDKKRAEIRNLNTGFVFQFYHLLPEFNALENVLLPRIVRRKRTLNVDEEQSGRDMLDMVGLSDRMDHKPYELSGGEQQRVAIARALINQPQILFCDEPTGNLDSESGAEVMDILFSMNKKHAQTCIIVTHDPNIAAKCSRSIHLKDGRLC